MLTNDERRKKVKCFPDDPCAYDHTCVNHWMLGDAHQEIADKEAALKEITESRDEWKRQWRLMEAAEKKAEEQITALSDDYILIDGQEFACSRSVHNAAAAREKVIRQKDEQIAALKDRKDELLEKLTALTAQLDAWYSVFGTTQLTHAQARLEQAEKERDVLTVERDQLRSDIDITEAALGLSGIYAKMEGERERLTAERDEFKRRLYECQEKEKGNRT